MGARERRVAVPAVRACVDRGGGRSRLCGLRPRPARLRRQEQLQGRGVRAFRRHRFGAVRRDGGRCARGRARARGDAALPLHVAGFTRGCRRGREGARHPVRHGADRGAGRRLRGGAETAVRRHQSRHHRREPAIAHARHDPDGDLQQVRPDGGDDRQQVGAFDRLCDALRRHERRLQSDQGSLQDRGVSACPAAQRLEARRCPGALWPSDPGQHSHASAQRRAA